MRTLGTFFALALAIAVTVPLVIASDAPNQDRLWAHFTHYVWFAGKLLPEGDYLFVHDDAKKAMGEPCLSVYRANDITVPLAAIHCVRKTPKTNDHAKIVWKTIRRDNVREFGYIQFPGDSFAHYAP